MENEEQEELKIPWLDRFSQPVKDEKAETEKVDFITTLMELEFR